LNPPEPAAKDETRQPRQARGKKVNGSGKKDEKDGVKDLAKKTEALEVAE
jgi:hypothetical protein